MNGCSPAMVFTSSRPGSSGVEQLTRNEQVAGSNPASGSKTTCCANERCSAGPGLSAGSLPTSPPPHSTPFPRALVPAYFGPWEVAEWAALQRLRPAGVVLNPDSGAGDAEHAGYRPIAQWFASQGTEVFGYIATNWLGRTINDLSAEAKRYSEWYGVTGLFFDEIPNGSQRGRTAFLRSLASLWGGAHTVFNCGQPVPARWYSAVPDVRFGTFEGSAEDLARSAFVGPPHRQLHLVHSVTAAELSTVAATLAQRMVAFACVTADVIPNPWDVCPGALMAGTS